MTDPGLQVQIMPATQADEPDLTRLKRDWSEGWFSVTVRWDEDWLIARRDGEAVAYLEGNHGFTNWGILHDYQDRSDGVTGSYVASMFVDESSRGAGLGGELLDVFVDHAWAAGSDVVVLSVQEGEDSAARERFFQRHGFSWAKPPWPQTPWLMTKTRS